jgi:hypothetical protein
MAENKTRATDASVADYLAKVLEQLVAGAVSEKRRRQG